MKATDGTDIKQLTGNSGPTNSQRPKWSPNGSQIAFVTRHPRDPR